MLFGEAPLRQLLVRVLLLGTLAGFGSGCSSQQPTAEAPVTRGEPLAYAFGTTDGSVVSSETTRGRVTVLLFLTTFDLASQAQAKHLEQLYRRHAPRFNAIAVVMEPPKYAELARSFGDVLGLSYPVALADEGTLSGAGPFGAVTSVPSWVVLDSEARAVFAQAGALAPRDLEKTIRAAER
jgi:hypothetical protein